MITYIDLGAMNGDTIQKFLRGESFYRDNLYEVGRVFGFELRDYHEEWKAVSAEFPNIPMLFSRKAVWTEDGTIPMSRTDFNRESHTIVGDCENYAKGETEEIEAINFSRWLQETVTDEEFVIVKMDIEGAEYAILEQLIADGSIKLINALFVEFHDWIMPESYAARRKKILETCPIQVQGWH